MVIFGKKILISYILRYDGLLLVFLTQCEFGTAECAVVGQAVQAVYSLWLIIEKIIGNESAV